MATVAAKEGDVDMEPVSAESAKPEGAATEAVATEEKKEEEQPIDDRVALAEVAKLEGNDLLKKGDLADAIAKYAEGIGLTEPILEKDPTEVGEELAKRNSTVYLALRLNSAQACLKHGDNEAAADHASKALLLDKDNTKALYRRAMACMQFASEGRLEQARTDLARMVQLEPSNRDAREQLAKAKEKLKAAKQLERERYSLAMKGGGLYKEQHDKAARQMLLYDEEVARRKEAGEDHITFEEWSKKEKEKREEEQKKQKEAREKAAEEERRQAEEKRWTEANEARKAQGLEELTLAQWREECFAASRKQDDVVKTDEIDLDEEEKKMLEETKKKGYYHGRLGTVLSSAAPKPQQVAEGEAPTSAAGATGASEWNQAGTWEEKDASTWAKAELKKHLSAVTVAGPCTAEGGEPADAEVSVRIDEVKKLNGDAQIVHVRKQQRHGFNFDVEMSFRMNFSSASDAEAAEKYKGVLTIPELADFVDQKDWRIEAAWKGKRPSDKWLPASTEWIEKLREEIRKAINMFLEEYKKR
eukprot:TRINITY_DN38284_c0_g1_i1.p1 TRINITY_DN38284_c0_g1~~TRINITY_DN38284_c0_g1_i1.p1  ORF type:complete len:552 (-),score=188.55 TRINITY_DN38284_c0_g1_i1:44-1636(-)